MKRGSNRRLVQKLNKPFFLVASPLLAAFFAIFFVPVMVCTSTGAAVSWLLDVFEQTGHMPQYERYKGFESEQYVGDGDQSKHLIAW